MSTDPFRLSVLCENLGAIVPTKTKTILEDIQSVDMYEVKPDKEETLSSILSKIAICPNLDSLLALDREVSDLGLTFQTLPGGKAVLCKIVNGEPSMLSAMDDFIILGQVSKKDMEISDRMVHCLQAFIKAAASEPAKVVGKSRSYHKSGFLYGQPPVANV